MQQRQHLVQHHHLLRRAVILVLMAWRRILTVSALIAYANRVSIEVRHMTSDLAHRPTVIHRAIPSHIHVIPRPGTKSSRLVVLQQSFQRIVLARLRVTAMQHQQVNPPR